MKLRTPRNVFALGSVVAILCFGDAQAADRRMESLDRGLVAINQGDGRVFPSRQLLAADSEVVCFNVSRSADGKDARKISEAPLKGPTTFTDFQADENGRETRIFDGRSRGLAANNGAKSNPCLAADIIGDWREELITRTADNRELRIYVSTIPTEHRLTTLMSDPQYRIGVAWQNVAYTPPTHSSYFICHNMHTR